MVNEKWKQAQNKKNQLEFDIYEAQTKLRQEKRKIEEVYVEEFAKQIKSLAAQSDDRSIEERDITIYINDFVQKIKDLHR